MPNGGGHFEEVGMCPHCGSGNIRIRRRVHAFLRWRCRRCNRVFRSPKFGTIDAKWGTKGFVLADSIPWRERRSRRKLQRILAAHAKRKFRRILAAIVILVIVGIVAWVGIKAYGPPTVTFTPDSATQEDSVPAVLDRDQNGKDEDRSVNYLSLTPIATPVLLATLVPTPGSNIYLYSNLDFLPRSSSEPHTCLDAHTCSGVHAYSDSHPGFESEPETP